VQESLGFLVAVVAALAFAFVIRQIVRRRIAQAEAVARAEAQARLATLEERLTNREERIATLAAEHEAERRRGEEARAAGSDLRSRLAQAETRREEEREQASAKTALRAEAEKKLADAFSSLAAKALDANAESFLRLAKESFAKLQTAAQGDLDQRRQAIEAVVAPMKEQLARYESGVRELEKAREQAYGTLSQQVRSLLETQEKLQLETGNLVKALRAPHVRGHWGEMHLRRAVEFAGMLDHVDFVEQETTDTGDSVQRPDMVVRLPGGKQIVVDAKAPLAAYLDAVEARDEDVRASRLAEHAMQVKSHIDKLGKKEYWSQFADAPDFVVLFLPGESMFSAALEQNPALIDHAFSEKVILATPTTLVALLKSVAYGWRQERLAENAREIASAARELYDRVQVFTRHFYGVGSGLKQALASYNKAAGSLTSRVFPQGRRLEELGAGGAKELVEPEPVDVAPRELDSAETSSDDDSEPS